MVDEAKKYSQICCSVSKPAQKKDQDEAYSEPSLAILGLNLLAVGHPVAVPAPQSSRVVDTNGVNALNFKSSTFERVDDETKRSRSVSTGEDVLVHEKTPDEILVLP